MASHHLQLCYYFITSVELKFSPMSTLQKLDNCIASNQISSLNVRVTLGFWTLKFNNRQNEKWMKQ